MSGSRAPRPPEAIHPLETPERDWVARIRSGDGPAFEALFYAYHAPLCAFAYRLVGVRDLAEEIVQEVFLYIWERRETWDVRTSVKSYLFTAVRNAAMSYLRHERVVRQREAETVELFVRPAATADGHGENRGARRSSSIASACGRWSVTPRAEGPAARVRAQLRRT